MIWYTFGEIITASASALIYGIIFSLLCSLSRTIFTVSKLLIKAFYAVFVYSGSPFKISKFKISDPTADKCSGFSGNFFTAVKAIGFSLGLTVLLYYTLDGGVRAFVVLFSLLSFLIVSRSLTPRAESVLTELFLVIIRLTIPVLRIILYPIRLLLKFIYLKCKKYYLLMSLFDKFSVNLTIDRHNL